MITAMVPSYPRFGVVLLLSCAALFQAAAAPPGGGSTVETFEGKPGFAIKPGLNPDDACTVVGDTGKARNHVLRLSWPVQNGTHAACNYQEAKVIVADAPGRYKISALANTEQVGVDTRQFALRVVDRNNEVFQLVAELKDVGAPGWSEVSWTLDTSRPNMGSVRPRGDQADGVVDLPVRLLGFALPFGEGSTPGGALLLDNVTVTKLAGK